MVRSFLAIALVAGGACKKERTPVVPEDPDPTTFAIRDSRVFDGAAVIERATVVVREGRIVSVGPEAPPQGVRVIDGEGATLVPGLIESHAHPRPGERALEQSLALGVTTVLGLTAPPGLAGDGDPDRAALLSSGWAVTVAGGLGSDSGDPERPAPVLDEGGDVEAFVRERIDEGADYIEILFDDGRAWKTSAPRLDEADLRRAIAAAHRAGKIAVTDTASHAETAAAVAAGTDGLAHIYIEGPDAELARTIAGNGTFVVATLPVMFAICDGTRGRALARDPRVARYLTPASKVQLGQSYHLLSPGMDCEKILESVRQLKEAGVALLAGSDAPMPGTAHGASLHDALALLVRAGLSPIEALAAATRVPAETYGLDDRGRIAPGLRADLVLIAGDPTSDITRTRDIQKVWKAGRALDRAAVARSIAALPLEPTPRLEPGSIGAFDDQEGAGWHPQSDRIDGGSSEVELAAAEPGASGTPVGLDVSGVVRGDGWAGVVRFVGDPPASVADLTAASELRFFSRGDGKRYEVLLVTGAEAPALLGRFTAGRRWTEQVVSISASRDRAVALVFRSSEPGEFTFAVDEVELR